ncbi:MAG: ATP-binding cassette domain-containing protein [Prevotellaceae bacterium]|nr:ATP-binding cassette domain-containing protein [Prevotellaceae bacterium]
MISVDHLSVEFSSQPLFSDVSFVVNQRERVALVGKNGAGKSTLLRVMAGQLAPSVGSVTMPAGLAVGYLAQVMEVEDGLTVRQEAEKAFSELRKTLSRLRRLEELMAGSGDCKSEGYLRIVDDYTRLSERFRILGGQNYQAELERILTGLGFRRGDLDRQTNEFSGGWRMRVELAKLLLGKPDVLLLDEPTNHLDIESIQWLEQFLVACPAAVMLVSHDRAFLNNVCQRTMEISCGKIYDYRVPYDQFVTLRKERREQQLRAYENQQKEIAETKEFIERFRYKPSKAVQVQSRIKRLAKIVPIEVDEVDRAALRLKFTCSRRSGDFPLVCEDVGKAYDHTVFQGVNLTIRRGEKVAFCGRNGEGKSTLVKCIMGEIPYDGKITLGHNVQIGYFAQNQAQTLDGELTVFDTIDRVARGDIRLKIRDLLGAFMFGGEASEKKVKVLSGGERSRLAMIKLLLEPVNFLILDEPTNHLDMRSKDVLKEAIRDFDGTVIVVSHDRDFLDGTVTRVYEFANARVREHIGGIYDFVSRFSLREATLTPAQGGSPSEPQKAPSQTRQSYEERKQRSRLQRKLEQTIKEAETAVAEVENAMKIIESKMSTQEGSMDSALYDKHASLQRQRKALEEDWAKAMEELEQMSSSQADGE